MNIKNHLKIYSAKDFPSYLPKLNQLYDDLFVGGKKFRAQLVREVSKLIGLPEKTQNLLAQTVEFIHNASLLHDDLIDRSLLRRGKTSAWVAYGSEYAVLAGDYLLARVMVNLSEYGNIKLVQYTALVISDLLEGEWLQDSLINDFEVSLDDLDQVHNLKTSSLFKWCLRAPFFAKNENFDDLHEFLEEAGTKIGILFQRGDDLLDFNVRNYENKEILGDLKAGYLNSFGSFCINHLNLTQKEKVKTCQNLDSFCQLIGGSHIFNQKILAFDEKNKKLIESYEHDLQQILNFFKSQKNPSMGDQLYCFLKPLPNQLYWRELKDSTIYQESYNK